MNSQMGNDYETLNNRNLILNKLNNELIVRLSSLKEEFELNTKSMRILSTNCMNKKYFSSFINHFNYICKQMKTTKRHWLFNLNATIQNWNTVYTN